MALLTQNLFLQIYESMNEINNGHELIKWNNQSRYLITFALRVSDLFIYKYSMKSCRKTTKIR